MRTTGGLWPGLAFLAGFLATGVPYWLVPYAKLNLPDGLLHPGLLLVGIAALGLRTGKAASFARSVNVTALSVPAAVMVRVLVDCLRDPTAHNLWPFELVIALMVGYAVATAGALAGIVMARVLRLNAETD